MYCTIIFRVKTKAAYDAFKRTFPDKTANLDFEVRFDDDGPEIDPTHLHASQLSKNNSNGNNWMHEPFLDDPLPNQFLRDKKLLQAAIDKFKPGSSIKVVDIQAFLDEYFSKPGHHNRNLAYSFVKRMEHFGHVEQTFRGIYKIKALGDK